MSSRAIFAKHLRLLRHQRGLSQEELSAQCGLDKNYIGKLEREENSPTLDTLDIIAEKLSTTAWGMIKPGD